ADMQQAAQDAAKDQQKDQAAHAHRHGAGSRMTSKQKRAAAWAAFNHCRSEASKHHGPARHKALTHCRNVLLVKLLALPGGKALAKHEICVHRAMSHAKASRPAALKACGVAWKKEVTASVATSTTNAQPSAPPAPQGTPASTP